MDIDKLKNVTSGLSNLRIKGSRLSDVVKNKVLKKTEYNELVKKVNNINTTDTSDLVKKMKWNC